MSYGRAWFPRESDALEQAVFGSYFQDLRTIEPPGLHAAADAVRRLIDAQGIPWDRVILGGFSQGAMVVAEMLRHGATDADRPLPAAAVLFSGALIAERWWDSVHSSRAQTVPVFQSHGSRDGILPVANGWALADRLTAAGFPVERREFTGGHEIPLQVQQAAAGFLGTHLGSD
jgi:phospholipase/carboxylesterase